MRGEQLEQLGEQIAEQAAHFDAAMHRLLTDLRTFDQAGGWHVQGAMSCAHWLAWRVGWDLVTARERVRVAGKLGEFGEIDDALRRGEISYSKARAMVRVATPANELLLLEHARLMTASQLEKLTRKYALVQRHGQSADPREDEQRRFVRRRDTEDGMVKIEAVLHPEEAELVWAMLDQMAARAARRQEPTNDTARVARESEPADDSAESRPDPGRPPGSTVRSSGALKRADSTSKSFDRVDALVSVAQSYLRGDRPERSPIEVVLTISKDSLRRDRSQDGHLQDAAADALVVSKMQIDRLEVGDPLEVGEMGMSCVSREAARRLSCDAGVNEVVEGEHGEPLSVGRKHRRIAGVLKRALHKRDQSCTFPGCTNHIFLEGHHIKHWADGGETTLGNTALLCSLHHRYVHEYGFTIELGSDQRPRFRDRHGRPIAAVPERESMTGELGWHRMQAANESLVINAQTCACEWDGRPVHYGTIVGHLLNADGLVHLAGTR